MRLLSSDIRDANNCYKLILRSFEGQNIPPYAILSHTWEDEEVLFSHATNGTATTLKGFQKLKFAADQAKEDGFEYVWLDTCCIDKSSSAELSEAINSMYAWYQNARICYAYLADVPATVEIRAQKSELTSSKWFTRGWCLQELLAPKILEFFSKEWIRIGSKMTLCSQISRITNIDSEILTGDRSLETASIATRMSWAAFRQTTRVEDVAYSLMGLFSVNMPMLYGEGVRAFHRLQEEILKHSDDRSIFAWVDSNTDADHVHGLLADSPAAFASSAGILQRPDWAERFPFEMTNRGLRIDVHLTKIDNDIYVAALHCRSPLNGYSDLLAIWLKKMETGGNQYARIKCGKFGSLNDLGPLKTIYVQQRILPTPTDYHVHLFQLRTIGSLTQHYDMVHAQYLKPEISDASYLYCTRGVNDTNALGIPLTFQISKVPQTLSAAILLQRKLDGEQLLLMLGSGTNISQVGFDAVSYEDYLLPDLTELRPRFNPQPPGQAIILWYHRVRFDIDTRIEIGMKIHAVDIYVETVIHNVIPPILPFGHETNASKHTSIKKSLKFWQRSGENGVPAGPRS